MPDVSEHVSSLSVSCDAATEQRTAQESTSVPSPAHLPAELLGQVFRMMLEPAPNQSYDDVFAIKHGFLISRVNRHFRSVAINTPRLWSVVDLDFTDSWFRHSGEPVKITRWECYFRTIMERSKEVPLDISLIGFDPTCLLSDVASEVDQERRFKFAREVFRTLESAMHRWRTMYFSFSETTAEILDVFAKTASFPRLEKLSLRSLDDSTTTQLRQWLADNETRRHTLLAGAVNLVDVSIDIKTIQYLQLGRHASRIKHLDISTGEDKYVYDDYHRLAEVLSTCSNLRTLKVTASINTLGSEPPPSHNIALPHLERLTLRGSAITVFVWLRDRLTPPFSALHTVCIERFNTDPASLQFLQIIGGHVRTLNLQTFRSARFPSATLIIDIASRFPELTDLTIQNSTTSAAEFVHLQPNVLPNLKRISLPFGTFVRAGESTEVDNAILEFVKARPGLEKFELPAHWDGAAGHIVQQAQEIIARRSQPTSG